MVFFSSCQYISIAKLTLMSLIKQPAYLTKILQYTACPVEMFKNIIAKKDSKQSKLLLMNIATIDDEFGVLNRTVVYRGLTEDNPPYIRFVTEKNSRKYQNLKENPKISVTILCPLEDEFWQIRLFNAEAVEIEDDSLKKLWEEEEKHAKIRSHLCVCGKPNTEEELDEKYQKILEKYEKECKEPEQTETYTAFKIIPKIWDFYKSEPNKIADRVQYKMLEEVANKWEIIHVDA